MARPRLSSGIGIGGPPMNLIQNHEIGQRLAQRFQLKERSPVPTLAMEIQPVVIVENLQHLDEDTGYRSFGGFSFSSPVAAQFGASALENPSGSVSIAQVDAVTVCVGPAGGGFTELRAGFVNGSIGPLASAGFCTSGALAGTLGESNVHAVVGAVAPSPTGHWGLQVPDIGAIPHRVELEHYTVYPGQALVVVCLTANTRLAVAWRWTEIPRNR